jgi:hypothetical protein
VIIQTWKIVTHRSRVICRKLRSHFTCSLERVCAPKVASCL